MPMRTRAEPQVAQRVPPAARRLSLGDIYFMVKDLQLEGTPLVSSRSPLHGVSAGSKGQGVGHQGDELHSRPRPSTASTSPRARSLLAVFVAVSAVVFLAYVCSVSIRRMITASSPSRRLADSSGGEGCEESADSRSTPSPAGQQVIPMQRTTAAESSHFQQDNMEHIISAQATAAASGKAMPGEETPPFEARKSPTGHKRKGEEQSNMEREPKQLRPETPPMEMPLQSPPPLDSDMDWLIDSVLLEDEQAVSAEFWISDDDPVDPITDSSTGATDVSESTPSESAPADSDTSVVETPLQPSPAVDPVINSHTDSESSGGKDSISEDVRTPESEPLHPVSDSSTVSMPPASRDDPEGPDADSGGGETVYASMQSVLPCAHKELNEATGTDEPSPSGSSDRQLQWDSPAGSEALHSGPSPDAVQWESPAGSEALHSGPSPDAVETATGSPEELTEEALAAPKEEIATSSEETVEESLPSSSGESPSSVQPSTVATPPQESESAEQDGSVAVAVCFPQSESLEQLHEDPAIFAEHPWLDAVYPGVPASVLRTHPFYHYPKSQPSLSTRPFNSQLAAFFASIQKFPGTALARCRDVLKKSSLTPQDLEDLVTNAERLCGYASARIPLAYRRGQAKYAKDTLGLVFVLLDTLHCAAETLGGQSMKQSWWPSIMRYIEGLNYSPKKQSLYTAKCRRNAEVSRTLDAALDYYRRGVRAPLRMVIGLMEALICEAGFSSKFSGEQWNPWRLDIERWRQSIELSKAKMKLD